MANQFTALGSFVGTFSQDVITTITPKILIDNVVDTIKGYKPLRNIVCFATTAAGSGGGVPLFLYTPIHDYVAPIVLKFIPFANDTLVDVGVGFAGFWVTGAVAYNVAKYTYREAARQYGGHPNSAYHFDEQTAEAIIDANPELYPSVATPASEKSWWQKCSENNRKRWDNLRKWCQGGEEEDQAENNQELENIEAGLHNKQYYIQKLMETLAWARNKIDEHKGDGTPKHKVYKYAFERALRAKDLDPLFEVINGNLSNRETRTVLAGNKASHIANIDFEQFVEEDVTVENAALKPSQTFSQNACRANELNSSKIISRKTNHAPKPLKAHEKTPLLASYDTVRNRQLGKFNTEVRYLPTEETVARKLLGKRGFKTRGLNA